MSKLLIPLAVVVVLAGPGCDLTQSGTLSEGSTPPAPQPEASSPATPDAPVDAEFPCEVRAVLETYCAPCHTGETYSPAFTTRADFLAPRGDAGTFGQYAAMRVMNNQMPPYNATAVPTAAERAVLIDWVAAGMPAGPCGPLTRPTTP